MSAEKKQPTREEAAKAQEQLWQAVAAEQKRALQLLYQDSDVIEVRLLEVQENSSFKATYAGYYNDISKLVTDLWKYDCMAKGVYTVANPFNPDLINRSYNRLQRVDPKSFTLVTDKDVTSRRWLLIDLDACRPAGISATDKEHEAALTKAKEVQVFLINEMSFSPGSIIFADSGNGAHLLIRIDLPNDDAAKDLIQFCLKALDTKFSDEKVKVDTSVYNASRIWKFYGSAARKGDHTPTRPHRRARLLEVPDNLVISPIEPIEKLASLAPKEEKKSYSIPSNVVNIPNKSQNNNSQSILERARKYLFCIPGAIAGQNGHGATFYAANILINGFELSFNDAFSLLLEWNSTCQPPWSNGELEHKLRDAETKGSSRERGYLLNQNRNDEQIYRKWDAQCLSDSTLEEIDLSNLRIGNIVRIRGQQWRAKVTGIDEQTRNIRVLFKKKKTEVVFHISELLWWDKAKNRKRAGATPQTTTPQQTENPFNDATTEESTTAPPAPIQSDNNPIPTISTETGTSTVTNGSIFSLDFLKECLKNNQWGDASLLVHLHANDLCFDYSTQKWFLWNQTYWQADETEQVNKLIAEDVANVYESAIASLGIELRQAQADGKPKEELAEIKYWLKQLKERAFSLRTVSRAKNVLEFAQTQLAITSKGWDSNSNLLPFQNGVFNLKTTTLIPHSPSHYLTWTLPYNYDPDATCEPIQQWFLESTRGDVAIVRVLLAYLKAILLGRVDLQCFLELLGQAGTGKSTYIRLAMALIGIKNAVSTTLAQLENNRFETSKIYGKRLVVITDSEKYTGSISVLKAITGQDLIRFEEKFKNSSDFTCPAMVLIAANQAIESNDYTSGLERRRRTIPFRNFIPKEKVRNLIEFKGSNVEGEFVPYLPGLFNLVLSIPNQEMESLLRNTDHLVPSLTKLKFEVIANTNPLAAWLNDNVVLDPTATTNVGLAKKFTLSVKDDDGTCISSTCFENSESWLYANYALYASVTGTNNKTIELRRFSDLLEDLCVSQLKLKGVYKPSRNKQGTQFVGLRIRTENDKDIPSILTGSFHPNEPSHQPEPSATPPSSDSFYSNKDNFDDSYASGDGLVMDCDGLVMAQPPMDVGSDGSDGFLEKSEKSRNHSDHQTDPHSDHQSVCSNMEDLKNPSLPSPAPQIHHSKDTYSNNDDITCHHLPSPSVTIRVCGNSENQQIVRDDENNAKEEEKAVVAPAPPTGMQENEPVAVEAINFSTMDYAGSTIEEMISLIYVKALDLDSAICECGEDYKFLYDSSTRELSAKCICSHARWGTISQEIVQQVTELQSLRDLLENCLVMGTLIEDFNLTSVDGELYTHCNNLLDTFHTLKQQNIRPDERLAKQIRTVYEKVVNHSQLFVEPSIYEDESFFVV